MTGARCSLHPARSRSLRALSSAQVTAGDNTALGHPAAGAACAGKNTKAHFHPSLSLLSFLFLPLSFWAIFIFSTSFLSSNFHFPKLSQSRVQQLFTDPAWRSPHSWSGLRSLSSTLWFLQTRICTYRKNPGLEQPCRLLPDKPQFYTHTSPSPTLSSNPRITSPSSGPSRFPAQQEPRSAGARDPGGDPSAAPANQDKRVPTPNRSQTGGQHCYVSIQCALICFFV